MHAYRHYLKKNKNKKTKKKHTHTHTQTHTQSPTETETETDLDVGADARLVLPHRHRARPAQRLHHQGRVPRQGRHLGELLFWGGSWEGGLWKRVRGTDEGMSAWAIAVSIRLLHHTYIHTHARNAMHLHDDGQGDVVLRVHVRGEEAPVRAEVGSGEVPLHGRPHFVLQRGGVCVYQVLWVVVGPAMMAFDTWGVHTRDVDKQPKRLNTRTFLPPSLALLAL